MIGRLALPGALVMLIVGGCTADDSSMAMVMCESFVDQRVGAGELEHLGPSGGATVEGDGPWVVHSGFTEPRGGGLTRYTCTIGEVDDGKWQLVDLVTDRG